MKLKYLLRGIGIGAILATAIMYFLSGKSDKTLSDDEIRQMARELGMMTVSEFQDKELNSLKDKLPEISDLKINEKAENKDTDSEPSSVTASDTKNTPSEEGGEAGESSDKGDKTGLSTDSEGDKTGISQNGDTGSKIAKAGNKAVGLSSADKAETTNTGNETSKTGASTAGNAKKENVALEQKEESGKTGTKVNFSITSGMSSENVANSLKNLGIVDNSADFNRYLVDNGYAARIKVGDFELQTGWSYAEIAARLTK